MSTSNNDELIQLVQDFVSDLGDNLNIEEYGPLLVRLLKEIEIDVAHGHEDNIDGFRSVLNYLGSEIQEKLNGGKWSDD